MKNMKNRVPQKGATLEEVVSQIWDAVFNHLPHNLAIYEGKLSFQDTKLNFVLAFLALLLALVGINIFN